MLRLTTLPIPNQPGVLTTRAVTVDEAIDIIRSQFREGKCMSHIGYPETQHAIERRMGIILENGERFVPAIQPGDKFLTVRLRHQKKPVRDMDDLAFLLTEYTS